MSYRPQEITRFESHNNLLSQKAKHPRNTDRRGVPQKAKHPRHFPPGNGYRHLPINAGCGKRRASLSSIYTWIILYPTKIVKYYFFTVVVIM